MRQTTALRLRIFCDFESEWDAFGNMVDESSTVTARAVQRYPFPFSDGCDTTDDVLRRLVHTYLKHAETKVNRDFRSLDNYPNRYIEPVLAAYQNSLLTRYGI